MVNEPYDSDLTYMEILQIGLLSLIITSIFTGAVGTISILILSYLGVNHVFEITLALQGLTTGFIVHTHIGWSLDEDDDIDADSGREDIIDTLSKKFSVDPEELDLNNQELEYLQEHIHEQQIESKIITVIGGLATFGLAIYATIIGFIKGSTLGGILTGLLGGIHGLGVGIVLGLLANFIIRKAFLIILPGIISIPLGMYLTTFEIVGGDDIVTVMISSYVWGVLVMLFSIFIFIIFASPKNRISNEILKILYHR